MTRRANRIYQEPKGFPVTHASTAATLSEKLWTIPAGKTWRLDAVWYNNPTGLAADASNYFTITIKKGTTVMFTWSTQTGTNGALAADTPVNLVPSATDADTVAVDGDVISMVLTKTGTQTLPAGRFMLDGRIL